VAGRAATGRPASIRPSTGWTSDGKDGSKVATRAVGPTWVTEPRTGAGTVGDSADIGVSTVETTESTLAADGDITAVEPVEVTIGREASMVAAASVDTVDRALDAWATSPRTGVAVGVVTTIAGALR
jgi:hypothetical protein